MFDVLRSIHQDTGIQARDAEQGWGGTTRSHTCPPTSLRGLARHLVAAGFDPDQPSFFLWESVTMYLDQQAVESTFAQDCGNRYGSVLRSTLLPPK